MTPTDLFVPATDHAPHGQAHASVAQHHVGQQLGRRSHRDALVVPQLVEPADRQSHDQVFHTTPVDPVKVKRTTRRVS